MDSGIERLLLESDECTIAERKLSHRKNTAPTPGDVAGMVVQVTATCFPLIGFSGRDNGTVTIPVGRCG